MRAGWCPSGRGLPPGGGAARSRSRARAREAAGVLRVRSMGSRASLRLGFGRLGFFFPEAPTSPSLGQLGVRGVISLDCMFRIFSLGDFGYSTSPPGVTRDATPQGRGGGRTLGRHRLSSLPLGPGPRAHNVQGLPSRGLALTWGHKLAGGNLDYSL